ncbi:hypothetical protein BDQ12DRAFT_679005 [Crucibulum laeve]|uniref:Uncharacterized protein n=1 Tax=Crucibulum laeve TaxID=68775 RepID=A0A5C3M748_9AGAR|nr:hypothetical protein BDQ12DRAFT_679005 [Crucibulum laeve]
MGAETFNRSRNFDLRWRLWMLIEEIVKVDPNNTPLTERTIDWLVEAYLARFLHRDLFRRIIAGEDNTIDEAGGCQQRRHLRQISRAEVRGYFAEQAEWLLAQQLVPKHKAHQLLNLEKWLEFCQEVKKSRRLAHQEGVRWGVTGNLADQEVYDRDGVVGLTRFGETPGFWDRKLKSLLKPRTQKRKASETYYSYT